jgi:methyltransferase family protein/DNA polymerase alpha-binding protein Ctf4
VTPDYQTPDRMGAKLKAIPLPDLTGRSVLDVGCDMRWWCDLAKERGAAKVTGVDRGRESRGNGFINCADVKMDLGRQYHETGEHDVVFCFSMYHHAYASSGGDHNAVWYWLSRQTKKGGELLWENPVDTSDPVVRMNVAPGYWEKYTREEILKAASRYFDYEFVGPAIHEPTREVYRFTRKHPERAVIFGFVEKGGGGAKGAFEYANARRCTEFEQILGWRPFAGSLNVRAALDFPWDENYYRAQVLDVVDRSKSLEQAWVLKWMRLYPLALSGKSVRAAAIRFEGEDYAPNFVEIIAEQNLSLATGAPYSTKALLEASGGFFTKNGNPALQVQIELRR